MPNRARPAALALALAPVLAFAVSGCGADVSPRRGRGRAPGRRPAATTR